MLRPYGVSVVFIAFTLLAPKFVLVQGRATRRGAQVRTIPNLRGEAVYLGQIYSARSDILLQHNLYTKEQQEELTDIVKNEFTETKYASNTNLLDRLTNMEIDVELKCSFMGGLVKVDGSARYLNTRDEKKDEVSFIANFRSRDRTKTLGSIHRKPDAAHAYVCDPKLFPDDSKPTHVVTQIEYGINANMVFRKTVKDTTQKQEIEGSLKIAIRSIPGLKIDGDASLNLTEKEKTFYEDVSLEFKGDVILNPIPTNLLEASTVYKKLTEKVSGTENVVKYKVSPLSEYCTGETVILSTISENEINLVSDMQAEFGLIESEIQEFKESYVAQNWPNYGTMFNLLRTRFNTYQNDINGKLKTILPQIRGGNDEAQIELTSILTNYTNSPFNYHTLKSFFDPRQKELETVQNYIDRAQEIPKKSHNFAIDVGSTGDGNNCLISHEYTLMFDLRILPKTEREDNLVLDYIKAEGTWNEDNKWFKNTQAVLKQGEVFNRFVDFTKYNQDEDLCFLIKLTKLDNEWLSRNERPAKLDVLERASGDVLHEDFKPPTQVNVEKVVTSWDSLTFELEFESNPFVTEVLTKYTDLSIPENLEVFKRTAIDLNQTLSKITLPNLKPNHMYQVSFTLTSIPGKGPESTPIRMATLPCSPPTRLEEKEITSRTAVLSWSEPSTIGPDTTVTEYEYRYKKEDSSAWELKSQNGLQSLITGLEPATKYAYQIKAMPKTQVNCSYQEGDTKTNPLCAPISKDFEEEQKDLWTEPEHFWTVPATPDPPAVVNQTEDTIDILWSSVDIAEEANHYGFRVQYRRDMDKDIMLQQHTSNPWISLSGLAAGETYQIKVRVLSSLGHSAWSAPAKAKTHERTETLLEKSKKDLGIYKLLNQFNNLQSTISNQQLAIKSQKLAINNQFSNLQSTISNQFNNLQSTISNQQLAIDNLNKQSAETITDLNNQSNDLQGQVTNLKDNLINLINKPKGWFTPKPKAFSCYRSADFKGGEGSTVSYDDCEVTTAGMNRGAGVFTCQDNGTWYFSFTGVVNLKSAKKLRPGDLQKQLSHAFVVILEKLGSILYREGVVRVDCHVCRDRTDQR